MRAAPRSPESRASPGSLVRLNCLCLYSPPLVFPPNSAFSGVVPMSFELAVHRKAIEIGKLSVEMTTAAGSGHPSTALVAGAPRRPC